MAELDGKPLVVRCGSCGGTQFYRWVNEGEIEVIHGCTAKYGNGLRAARRCAEMLETSGVMLPIVLGETKQDRCARFAKAMAAKIRKEFGLEESEAASRTGVEVNGVR